jgi:hypothetical protein
MTEEVVQWLRAIAANPADALEKLRSEGILNESFFLRAGP